MHTALQRFTDAQASMYQTAYNEISKGRKESHWMWFIFPQVQGLGFSETSRFYAIADINEAAEYLRHPVLGARLISLCELLLGLENVNAHEVFGSPDDVKLQSSMTLFASLPDAPPVFQSVLNKYFAGKKDERTLAIIGDMA